MAEAASHPGDGERGRRLLGLARQAITAAVAGPLSQPTPEARDEAWLRAPGATFVTLTRAGRLRGCMGSIAPRRPLGEDVRANARAAALADPRFAPLAAFELAATRVEVSLLSAATPLAADTEAAALSALRPGRDGVILEHRGEAHATFLPQVWESLPEPREFLAQLKRKAGLPPGFWSPDLRLAVYTVMHWHEPG
jgi:AmmeMemoRadiSam system protein A